MKRKTSNPNSSTLLLALKQAFTVNKNPLPWLKAFIAGVCAGFPVLVGYLFGSLEYGLIAGIGGLTYLYVFNIPYAFRAKKLLFAVLALSVAMGLGTYTAPYPFISAIMVAIVGAVVTFLFGALRITGPAAIFIVLTFLMGNGMPVDPELAPLRAGLVFLGGAFSWIIGMIGWLANPHGPEKVAVQKVYVELAAFMESLGTEHFKLSRQKILAALKSADELLLSGYIPWRVSDTYKLLVFLNEQANRLFLHANEHLEMKEGVLSDELIEGIRSIAKTIDNKGHKPIQSVEIRDDNLEILYDLFNEASTIVSKPIINIHREIIISKPSLRVVLGGAFDKNSVVFLTALRYGVVLFVAAIVAQSFDFNRSFWVTLSCAAVLSGATIVATFHRAIQRSIGTLVGILIASAILYFQPEGYVIIFAIFLLTFLTELAIVLNYGIAALFITPNALLLSESTTHIHDISYFASARIIDVLIGSAIGLIGAFLISRKSASVLLPHTIAKTIRSQQQFIVTLFSAQPGLVDAAYSKERNKMQTNLTNLKIVHHTALGEIPRDTVWLDHLFPVIHSIEQLGYLLDLSSKYKNRPLLTDEEVSQMLLVFETMAKAADQQLSFSKKTVPDIKGFSKIQKEIEHLQDTLLYPN